MDPFEILIAATGTGVSAGLAGLLGYAAHQRAAAHRRWRQRLRAGCTDVRTFPYWMTAGTVAGLV
jgi:hypothetical protein